MPGKLRATDLLGSLWVWLVLITGAIIILPCSISMAVWSLFFPYRLRELTRRFNWCFGRITLTIIAPVIPYRLERTDLAVRHPGSILICNHQSALDLYLLAAQDQSNLCIVAKHWPFRLFFFAPAMRHAGFIDAENMEPEAFQALCCQRLKEGVTLVMFPEGRRSRDGRLGRFHSGAFRVAVASGRPVLPLVIHDSRQVFPPGAKWFRMRPVKMDFLDPIWPGDFADSDLPHRAMMRYARQAYVERLGNV